MNHHTAKPGTVKYSFVEMTQMVMPQCTNALGTIFGGQVMSWIDICASVSAQRHCRSNVVTASFDDVAFIHPIKKGYVVILESQVNACFHTSMEIGTVIIAENPLTGDRKVAIRAYSTFVSLDDFGKPKPCPPLITETAEEKRREQMAHKRRARRLEHRKQEEEEITSFKV